MKNLDHLMENDTETLSFLRTRFPIHHLSNVFFRDIQYGIQTMLDRKGAKVGYTEAERLATEFVGRLEKKKILVPIDRQSWVVYSEEFKTVAPKRPAALAVKAAPATQASTRPAGGLPSLKSSAPATSLPPLKSSAPAAGKPAGLPPLNSSAPVGGLQEASPSSSTAETALGESPAPPPAVAAPAPAPKQESPTPKPQQAGAKRALPPIKSSTPAGSKK